MFLNFQCDKLLDHKHKLTDMHKNRKVFAIILHGTVGRSKSVSFGNEGELGDANRLSPSEILPRIDCAVRVVSINCIVFLRFIFQN